MKTPLTCLMISFCVLFLSCDKNRGTDPPPPVPEPPPIPTIGRITYREIENNNVVEEIYLFKYDTDGRFTGCDRLDKSLPSIKVNYSGNDLTSVVVYTTIGTVGATYVTSQSLFIQPDTISFYHVVDLSSVELLDTVFQKYIFADSALQKGTIRMGSASEDLRSTYNNMICTYGNDKNLTELGYVNTSQQYIKHMDVLDTDGKINPIRYLSPLVYAFVIINIDAELLTGNNNITAVRYADGNTAEFEYTYNEKGFPLTVKEKGQNFAKYEFQYRQ